MSTVLPLSQDPLFCLCALQVILFLTGLCLCRQWRYFRNALCLVSLVLFLWGGLRIYDRGIFTPYRWSTYNPTQRHYMLRDLECLYPLIGKSNEHVEQLLGAPDNRLDADHYSYLIAQPSETITLDITFVGGYVTEYTLTHH